MMGITTTACPEDEGIRKLINPCARYMPQAANTLLSFDKGIAMAYTTVSIICPSSATTKIARDSPISSAAIAMPAAPCINSSAIFSKFPLCCTMPTRRPMAKNRAEISEKYHPYFITPKIRMQIVAARIARMIFL